MTITPHESTASTATTSFPTIDAFARSSQRTNYGTRVNMSAIYQAKPASYKLAKRLFDAALSAAALVALSPVFLATAIAIVLEDGTPVIYKAPRKGKDGKLFSMYKFRSMQKDSDAYSSALLEFNEQTAPAFKIENDPRITRVGRFIRRYCIDELPQLVNVLRGDMSIVGPRAIQQTKEYTPFEAQRLVVQPGLTCYWQISGRNEIGWEEWVELDLDYIEDMSFTTDVLIILKTFPVVLSGTGN